jgi:hypothetical protein
MKCTYTAVLEQVDADVGMASRQKRKDKSNDRKNKMGK